VFEKFAKSANKYFFKKTVWVSKNAEFYADFTFLRKPAKTFTAKKIL